MNQITAPMRCPRCDVDMVFGQAIKSGPSSMRNAIIAFRSLINAENLELVRCWKCPKCGHSDDGT